MNRRRSRATLLGACWIAIVVAARPAPATVGSDPSRRETIVHSFRGTDGLHPSSGVIVTRARALLGTASDGGAAAVGAVFEIDRRNGRDVERVAYDFRGGTGDGAIPFGGLVEDGAGDVFGTTGYGGTFGGGTAFELSPARAGFRERVLHSFGGPGDGATPLDSLTPDGRGGFYGTTSLGGRAGCGTAFRLAPGVGVAAGAYVESTIYAFRGSTDGCNPAAALLATASGALLGTTATGGNAGCRKAGCGTVFALDPTRGGFAERVLYRFRDDGLDGNDPEAGLVADGTGDLFGTTTDGGTCAIRSGCGTVFELARVGFGFRESILHRFAGGVDGEFPEAAVTLGRDGRLFGTTAKGGGGPGGCRSLDCGTVFELARGKTGFYEEILYRFQALREGDFLNGPLVVDDDGALLGTTWQGGAFDGGTVFRLGR